MPRASLNQRTQRLNLARYLLQRLNHAEALRELAHRCSISRRQAYRYLEHARRLQKPLPLTPPKIAFTVKLNPLLVSRLRRFARERSSELERERQPGVSADAGCRAEAWLSDSPSPRLGWIWNISLTVSWTPNLPGLISSWHPTRCGRCPTHRRNFMNQPAALYARVSSQRQKENQTIASQTDALIQYARTHGYHVPPEWRFQDEGYSGDSLQRPGLEAIRDLAAEGKISAVLVYSPDRLSRKYTYQVVLSEEFLRCGVQLVFLQSPSTQTPEDRLAVQLQGMIAEYERTQIAERTRRGKRHRAQQGSVTVLVAAPYGDRYIKKSAGTAAYYQVAEAEASVVRGIFDAYTREQLSLGAIARRLNDQHGPTRTGALWDRSTLLRLVRIPAYQGRACYGKTQLCPRSERRMYRQVRLRGGLLARRNAQQERPRSEWIEVPVPALISEQTFALAQQQLGKNKQFASRRTLVPTLLQGMLVCRQCGYALCRTATRSGGRAGS